jgi:hypothetical protein
MNFLGWISKVIAAAVTVEVIRLLKDEREKQTKLNAITVEAKGLMGELDNAQSESERKAILRKIANFSDVSKSLL